VDRNARSVAAIMIEEALKVLPKSISSVVASSSVSPMDVGLSKLFSPKSTAEVVGEWSQSTTKSSAIIRYGKLIGGITGLEVLPFVSMPLLEPEIHPSYTLKSVVLADPSGNKYADSEFCTRDSLAEALARLVAREAYDTDALIVSITGSSPSDKEWDRLFQRVASKQNAELLRMEFGSIVKPDALLQWLVDTWFSQALVEADAATVLTGARPVRAVKTSSSSAEIKWDDLTPELTVRSVGSLVVSLDLGTGSGACLVITRNADKPLPNESQLIDKLVEGVNKTVFKKGFCSPSKDVTVSK
jgi:hypothetical protein